MSILLNWTLYNDTESVIKATDKDAQWDLLAILFSFLKKNFMSYGQDYKSLYAK